MKAGFIGLGRMGLPMATNLARAGMLVAVHNRTPSKARDLAAAGITVAATPADVARQADVVFTCLLYPSDVERVYLGPGGLLEGARRGQVFVDTSTVDPDLPARLSEALAPQGVEFMDAPISGGVQRAAEGKLAIMAGGSKAAFAAARPALEHMGNHVFHLGPVGSGTAMKLVNQLLVATGEALAAEAVVFAVKAGLNARDVFDVVQVSSGHSFAFDRVMKDFVLRRNFEPAATVNLILKDLDCIAGLASRLGVQTPLSTAARQAFHRAREAGHGELDLASVILPFEQAAGVQVGPA